MSKRLMYNTGCDERRCLRLGLWVVTDRSGEDDNTLTSDDKLDNEVLDLLRSIALAAGHIIDKLHEYIGI